jgi:hypothetical protein
VIECLFLSDRGGRSLRGSIVILLKECGHSIRYEDAAFIITAADYDTI